MLSLTFYGGVGQIGGNKVLLEDGDTRLFFDFGIPYSLREDYFEEYLKPRPGAGLLDLLELGLLPPLRGIYREDLAPQALWQRFTASPLYRELDVAAVLISHAHLDHMGYVSFLREDIPVYCSAMSAFIARAMQDTGPDFEKELCYSNPRQDKDGYLASDPRGSYRQRCFVFADSPELSEEARSYWNTTPARKKLACQTASYSPQAVGPLAIRHFPVDHSIFGATAYAVETSRGWVAYSGDLRLHGLGGAQTEKALEEMGRLRPFIYIGEGTRAGEEKGTSENDVYENARSAVAAASGLVVADFGPRNVERLITFVRIARETERHLVILDKDAYLLDKMALVSPQVPDLEGEPGLYIYEEPHGQEKGWLKEVLKKHPAKLVGPAAIAASPQEYILSFSFWDINGLIDIAPRDGLYIYSSSEAYGEEQRIDMDRLRKWLDHFGLKAIGLPSREYGGKAPPSERGLHASGHASGPELVEMVKRIGPRIFIPIHTKNPDYFQDMLAGTGIEVRLPEDAPGRMAFP